MLPFVLAAFPHRFVCVTTQQERGSQLFYVRRPPCLILQHVHGAARDWSVRESSLESLRGLHLPPSALFSPLNAATSRNEEVARVNQQFFQRAFPIDSCFFGDNELN